MALGVLVTLVLVLVWNLLIFSPKGQDPLEGEDGHPVGRSRRRDVARARLPRLQDISHNGPAIAAELDKLSAAVPASPDLDGFILSANQIAVTSGIDWLSVSPSIIAGRWRRALRSSR